MTVNSLNRILALLLRLIDTKNATKPQIPFLPQKPAPQIRVPQDHLTRVTPESEGVPSELLQAYVESLRDEKTTGQQLIMVARHGNIICEASYAGQNAEIWKNIYSASKSVTALAIGLLMDEHLLSASDKVVDLLGDIVPPFARLRFSYLTVKHLLTMTSCVTFNEAASMTETDWIKGFFSATLKGKPGKTFAYNSLNSYILSVIVRTVSGESLTDYLRPRIFTPLGITDFYWERCPKGIEKGGWGLYMKSEDVLKIGTLLLQNGMWHGKQLVSSKFIEAATKKQISTPKTYGHYDYGYQMWIGRGQNTFLFNGMTGQNMLCFRDSGIAVMSNAGNGDVFQQNKFFGITETAFGTIFASTLPENSEANKRLKRVCAAVAKTPVKMPFDMRAQLCNKRFEMMEDGSKSVGLYPTFLQIVQNNYSSGTSSISFESYGGDFFMKYNENDESYRVEIGFRKPAVTALSMHGECVLVHTLGRFAYDEDGTRVFIIKIDFVETPCSRVIKMFYMDEFSRFEFSESPGVELMRRGSDLLYSAVKSNAIGAAAISKVDTDYIYYKIQRLFEPVLKAREYEC